jgi:hypothetical protein
MNEHVATGSAGFKGYDYQITATVWVALELFLGQQHSTTTLIEPVSQEDIEATVIRNSADFPNRMWQLLIRQSVSTFRLSTDLPDRGTCQVSLGGGRRC